MQLLMFRCSSSMSAHLLKQHFSLNGPQAPMCRGLGFIVVSLMDLSVTATRFAAAASPSHQVPSTFRPPPGLAAPPLVCKTAGAKHRSPAKQRRDYHRSQARHHYLDLLALRLQLRWQPPSLKNVVGHISQDDLFHVSQGLTRVLTCMGSIFGRSFHAWMSPECPANVTKRTRDLFPLPPVSSWPLCVPETPHLSTALSLLNGCILALNLLAGDLKTERLKAMQTEPPTLAQRAAHNLLAKRCGRFVGELHSCQPNGVWENAFNRFETDPKAKNPDVKADAVDLPDKAATCNPESFLPCDSLGMVTAPHSLFDQDLSETLKIQGPSGSERVEYLRLVLRQLFCGKVKLRLTVVAVADVFCVGKSGGRLREVWNGSDISDAAQKPPAQPLLANPSCFVDFLFREGENIYMSKRDILTCYDVIQAPTELQKWFGRPPVTLEELASHSHLSLAELEQYVVDSGSEKVSASQLLYPSSTVWPMGFSWSSFVAQSLTINSCQEAGVDDADFLSMGLPPPSGPETCGVATDDIFFIHRDKILGGQRLERLDAILKERGTPKNPAKVVNLERGMTALGCELTCGFPINSPETYGVFTYRFGKSSKRRCKRKRNKSYYLHKPETIPTYKMTRTQYRNSW